MGNVLAGDFEVTENLYLNAELADVHFVCKSDDDVEKVPANKSLLAVTSPVFKKMFFGPMKETGDVEIVDANVDAFKEFLKFFYFRNVKLTMENMKIVFDLVEKYDIWNCATKACILQTQFDSSKRDNIEYSVWFYQQIIYLKMETLISEEPFDGDPNDLFSSDSFKCVDLEILKHILELNLSCKEVDIVNAILTWAKHKYSLCDEDGNCENLKNHLGDCLKSIRYNRMTIEEFNALALSNVGLFTSEEFQDIVFMLTLKGYKPKIFSQIPRWNKYRILQCKRKSSSGNKQLFHNPETVLFTSNQPILLKEIHADEIDIDLYIIDMNVTITEIDTSNDARKDLYSGIHRWFRKFLLEDETNFPMKIILPKPILIQTESQYEIRVRVLVDLDETITTDHTWEPSVQLEDGVNIEFHRDPSLKYDTSTSGWISRLDFNRLE